MRPLNSAHIAAKTLRRCQPWVFFDDDQCVVIRIHHYLPRRLRCIYSIIRLCKLYIPSRFGCCRSRPVLRERETLRYCICNLFWSHRSNLISRCHVVIQTAYFWRVCFWDRTCNRKFVRSSSPTSLGHVRRKTTSDIMGEKSFVVD